MAAPPLHGEVSKTCKKQRHEGRQSQRLEGRQSQRLEGRQSQWLKGRQSQWHIIIPWRQRRRRDRNTGKMAPGTEREGHLLPHSSSFLSFLLPLPLLPPSAPIVRWGVVGSVGAAAGRAGCGALRRSRRREAGPDAARRKSAAGRVGAGLDAGVGAARACSDGARRGTRAARVQRRRGGARRRGDGAGCAGARRRRGSAGRGAGAARAGAAAARVRWRRRRVGGGE